MPRTSDNPKLRIRIENSAEPDETRGAGRAQRCWQSAAKMAGNPTKMAAIQPERIRPPFGCPSVKTTVKWSVGFSLEIALPGKPATRPTNHTIDSIADP